MVSLPNDAERINLIWELGLNKTNGEAQWQARKGNVLHVPSYNCPSLPTRNGETWSCLPLQEIGCASLRGLGVTVVWLIERVEEKPAVAAPPVSKKVSRTQLRRRGRKQHRMAIAAS